VNGDGDGDVVDQRQRRVSIATIRSRRWLARRWCSVSRTRSTTRASRMAAHAIAEPVAVADDVYDHEIAAFQTVRRSRRATG
jgi:hypothetical protein